MKTSFEYEQAVMGDISRAGDDVMFNTSGDMGLKHARATTLFRNVDLLIALIEDKIGTYTDENQIEIVKGFLRSTIAILSLIGRMTTGPNKTEIEITIDSRKRVEAVKDFLARYNEKYTEDSLEA